MNENCYTECFLCLLSQTLLYHWCTPKYSHHIALDKLHGRIQDHIDKFIEVYLARFKKQPVPKFTIKMSAKNDCENMDEYYNIQIEYLKKIKTSLNKANELQGIIESMIADIQQFLYLIRLE